jgi:hypothetical protein
MRRSKKEKGKLTNVQQEKSASFLGLVVRWHTLYAESTPNQPLHQSLWNVALVNFIVS